MRFYGIVNGTTLEYKKKLKSASEYCLRQPDAPGMSKAPIWLNETQTLHEQDILEDEELVFAIRPGIKCRNIYHMVLFCCFGISIPLIILKNFHSVLG